MKTDDGERSYFEEWYENASWLTRFHYHRFGLWLRIEYWWFWLIDAPYWDLDKEGYYGARSGKPMEETDED